MMLADLQEKLVPFTMELTTQAPGLGLEKLRKEILCAGEL